MLRHPPKFGYCGLTIVMSNPSRFDNVSLLSANGGGFFESECLYPFFNRHQCDIRLVGDKSPLLPETKGVLLLGEKSLQETTHTLNSLGEMRGSPWRCPKTGILHIASYNPQDCVDVKNYEARLNPFLLREQNDTEDDEETSEKRHGKTNWTNYGFWLQSDTAKIARVILNGGQIPYRFPEWECTKPTYIVRPRAEQVIELLTNTKGQFLYFDMETDVPWMNMLCFAFSFDEKTIYTVPILLPNYTTAYTSLETAKIMRALAIGARDSTLVAHNGASFDYLVLALKHKIAIRSVYDTLVAQHRCFPAVEKSLGHCISYWTYLPFHKDEGSGGYNNYQQAESLWSYCGKDVYTMVLVHKHQIEYAKSIKGLTASIDQAQRSIRPYIGTTLTGMLTDMEYTNKKISENDRLMMQYWRCIRLLVGEDTIRTLQANSTKPMPSSNPQCVKYFHDMLGYKVVARSVKTGGPSLDEKSMYKLALRQNNPVIDFILKYRQTQKETSAMKFIPLHPFETQIKRIGELSKV
jgi:hypothetical protein